MQHPQHTALLAAALGLELDSFPGQGWPTGAAAMGAQGNGSSWGRAEFKGNYEVLVQEGASVMPQQDLSALQENCLWSF